MSGHVFHPGHAELHGITVVVAGSSGRTYVGRYHEETANGVLLHDVAVHEPAPGGDAAAREAFVARTRKFGIKAEHRHLVVPHAEVERIVRLVEWTAS